MTERSLGVVGIVGSGTMGAGIAQVALEAGHEVRITDVQPRAVERARDRIADGLRRRASKAGLDETGVAKRVESQLARLQGVADVATAARGATLVVEAALEELAIKREVFAALDDAALDDAILATNTSALSVRAIADATRHPARVVGLHFFNPAPLMPLVEVISTPTSDPAFVDRAEALMTAWGKTPIRSADVPGFIVNRVNRPFTLEPLRMLDAGLAGIERIDAAIHDEGWPLGPFAYMDLVGLDINLASTRSLFEALDRPDRLRPSPIQERMVAAGELGRKTGAGFYRYGPDGGATGLAAMPEPVEDGPEASAIVERVRLALANEAFFALGDGVATEDDIDRAMRLGASHPSGPIEWARARGLPVVAAILAGLARVEPRFAPSLTLLAAAG